MPRQKLQIGFRNTLPHSFCHLQFNQTALKNNLTDFLFIENVKANLSSISKRQSAIFGAAEPFTLNIDGQMMSYISNDNDVADPNLTLN